MTPSTATADAILDLLTSWSANGLLAPFCWWPLSADGEVHRTSQVTRVVAGQRSEVPLPEGLSGGDPADTAEMVAFYPASANEAFDARFADRVRAALTEVEKTLPPTRSQRPAVTMIVSPGEIGQTVPEALYAGSWAARVYVAPEDRLSPTATNQLTPATYPAHAAHALASLGDIWTPSVGTRHMLSLLADRRPDPFDDSVQVARAYTRQVDFGYLTSQLAGRVFRPGKSWPNPGYAEFEIADDQETIDYLVSGYLAHYEEVLGLSRFEPIPPPQLRELSLLAALRELIEILVRRAWDRPRELVVSTYNQAHDRLAAWIEKTAGPGSGFKVVRRNAADIADFDSLIPGLDDRPLVASYGEVGAAWRDLVAIALGLIDGSRIPDIIDASVLAREGKRIVITKPDRIVPDPEQRPARSAALADARACDPLALDPGFAPPKPEKGAEESDETYTTRKAAWDEDMAERASWADGRSDTVLWKVGASIARALQTASTAHEQADIAEEAKQHEEQRVEREHNWASKVTRERKRARRSFIAATIATLAAWYLAWTHLPFGLSVLVTLAVAAGWTYHVARLAVRVILLREEPVVDLLSHEIQWLNTRLERSLRAGDAVRLSHVYDWYLDWAEIIGWLCFKPWVGDPLRRIDMLPPLDTEALPAAFRVGVADTEHTIDDLAAQARARMFGRDWLTGLYNSTEGHVLSALDRRRGLEDTAPTAARANAVRDTGDDPEGARRELLAGVRRGDGRRLGENALAQELLDFVTGQHLDRLATSVRPQKGVDSAVGLPIAASWFSPPENLADLSEQLEQLVVRVDVVKDQGTFGGTGVLLAHGRVIVTARHIVEGATEVAISLPDGVTVPARVLRVAPHTDLALLEIEVPPGAGARLANDDLLRTGDPVVSLGHPKLQDGATTLAWGLVTATDRHITVKDPPKGVGAIAVVEANYASAPGASGSAVFDLNGRLVGIHIATGGHEADANDAPEYLSYAVPASEVRVLAEDAAIADEAPPASEPYPSDFSSDPREAPSDFLCACDSSDKQELPHMHWADLTGKPQLVDVVVQDPVPTCVSDLAQTPGFFDAIRARVTGVEFTRTCPYSALQSCSVGISDGTARPDAVELDEQEIG